MYCYQTCLTRNSKINPSDWQEKVSDVKSNLQEEMKSSINIKYMGKNNKRLYRFVLTSSQLFYKIWLHKAMIITRHFCIYIVYRCNTYDNSSKNEEHKMEKGKICRKKRKGRKGKEN